MKQSNPLTRRQFLKLVPPAIVGLEELIRNAPQAVFAAPLQTQIEKASIDATLYAEPNLNYYKGEFNSIEPVATPSVGYFEQANEWIRIGVDKTGQEMYIPRCAVDEKTAVRSPNGYIAKANLRIPTYVFNKPGSATKGKINAGSSINVLSGVEGWKYVSFNGLTGWILSGASSYDSSIQPTPVPTLIIPVQYASAITEDSTLITGLTVGQLRAYASPSNPVYSEREFAYQVMKIIYKSLQANNGNGQYLEMTQKFVNDFLNGWRYDSGSPVEIRNGEPNGLFRLRSGNRGIADNSEKFGLPKELGQYFRSLLDNDKGEILDAYKRVIEEFQGKDHLPPGTGAGNGGGGPNPEGSGNMTMAQYRTLAHEKGFTYNESVGLAYSISGDQLLNFDGKIVSFDAKYGGLVQSPIDHQWYVIRLQSNKTTFELTSTSNIYAYTTDGGSHFAVGGEVIGGLENNAQYLTKLASKGVSKGSLGKCSEYLDGKLIGPGFIRSGLFNTASFNPISSSQSPFYVPMQFGAVVMGGPNYVGVPVEVMLPSPKFVPVFAP
ncbi:MAG: hypothetical protein V1859_05585 [archaeon]